MNWMEFRQLAEQYKEQTCHHSLPNPMRGAPAYKQLIEQGWRVVPFIIEGFKNHEKNNAGKTSVLGGLDFELWGMSWVLILADITHGTPIKPEPVAGGLMVAWDVNATCKAWIHWYREHGLRFMSESAVRYVNKRLGEVSI